MKIQLDNIRNYLTEIECDLDRSKETIKVITIAKRIHGQI